MRGTALETGFATTPGAARDPAPGLVVFDVDGTLVDSQAAILAAIAAAFARAGHAVPGRAEALGIVGLSLVEAMATLLPGAPAAEHVRLAGYYRDAANAQREAAGDGATSPLFPGAVETVARLRRDGWLLAIATGKARRGLDRFLAAHGLEAAFSATQTADDAPSKPHPRMVLNCLSATGVAAGNAVMVGDTAFDMAMGRAAGCRTIGVSWGYHPPARVQEGGAERMVTSFAELEAALQAMREPA